MVTKILAIGILPPPINGQSVAFQALIDGFKKEANIETDLLLLPQPKTSSLFKFFHHIRYFLYFIKKIKNNNIVYLQVTQSYFGLLRDLPVLFISKLLNKKTVIHIHGGYYSELILSFPKLLYKPLFNFFSKMDKIIVLSEGIKETFKDYKNFYDKIRVVQNGTIDISPNVKFKNINLSEGVKVLFLSNLIESKGYLDVLKSLEILINTRKIPILGYFAGEFENNNHKKMFFNYLDENKLNEKVKYLGIVKGDIKNELLKKSDIFILPTYYINEGQPISVLEAMACATVVITTEYRGLKSLIQNYENGLFVEPKNPEMITQKIEELIENKDLYEKISQKSRECYLQNYTLEKHLETLIQEIIN